MAKGGRVGRQQGGKVGRTGGDRDNDFLDSLKDANNVNDFIRANMSNPEFKAFGRRSDVTMDDIGVLWADKRVREESRTLHEIPIEEAVRTLNDNIERSTLDGWFRNADSGYKPKLVESMARNPGVYNAAMNIAYYNYSYASKSEGRSVVPFKQWLTTPQRMYRGDHGQRTVQGDWFSSYSTDRKIAQKFGSNMTERVVRPIDTWGSYMTTAEQEYLVPMRKWKNRHGTTG